MLLLQINNNIRHPDGVSWNHVSMCILNGGAIRSPIDERNNGKLPRLRVGNSVRSVSDHAHGEPRLISAVTATSCSSVRVHRYSIQCLTRTHTFLCVLVCIHTQR